MLSNIESIDFKSYFNTFGKRLSKKSSILAKKSHELGVIYIINSLLEGLNLSYTSFNYVFTQCYATREDYRSPSDAMHEWFTSLEGGSTAVVFSIAFATLSLLADRFSDEEKHKEAIKRYLVEFWPYLRDTMRSLKNGYKVPKNLLQVSKELSHISWKSLLIPLSLSLGVFSMVNRLWYRRISDQRKLMQKSNKNLLKHLQECKEMTLTELDALLLDIEKQSNIIRASGYFSKLVSSLIDSLALYFSIFSISAFAPPVLITMLAFSIIYLFGYIAAYLHQEYEAQNEFLINQTEIELAIEEKKREILTQELAELGFDLKRPSSEHQERLAKLNEVEALINQHQATLKSLTSNSYFSAFLRGTKQGIVFYKTLMTLVSILEMILYVSALSFPPALVIGCVVSGLPLIATFITRSLMENYRANNNKEMVAPSSFEKKCEVAQGFTKGITKGPKTVDFMLNPLKELGDDAHYHESTFMASMMIVNAVLQAIIMGLKKLASNFGKDDKDKQKKIQATSVKNQDSAPISASTLDSKFSFFQKGSLDLSSLAPLTPLPSI